jgi:hypothetical protein
MDHSLPTNPADPAEVFAGLDWDKVAKALKPVYTAPTEADAAERFLEFDPRRRHGAGFLTPSVAQARPVAGKGLRGGKKGPRCRA